MHTAIGAVAGVVEVTIMQPTVAIKNALQVRDEMRGRGKDTRWKRGGSFAFFFFPSSTSSSNNNNLEKTKLFLNRPAARSPGIRWSSTGAMR